MHWSQWPALAIAIADETPVGRTAPSSGGAIAFAVVIPASMFLVASATKPAAVVKDASGNPVTSAVAWSSSDSLLARPDGGEPVYNPGFTTTAPSIQPLGQHGTMGKRTTSWLRLAN